MTNQHTNKKIHIALIFKVVILINLQYTVYSQADSPCPDIFRYQYDNRVGLYGLVRISSPPLGMVQLDIELSIGNIVEGYNGNIELAESHEENFFNDLKNHKPIIYKLFFPVWRGIPPKITKILVNGNIICAGPNIAIGEVPIVTTVNLQHTFRFDPQMFGVDTRYRNGITVNNNQFNSNPPLLNSNIVNNFKFRPRVPKNISAIYVGNPFFLSTTATPSTNFTEKQYTTNLPDDGQFIQRNPLFTNNGISDPPPSSLTSNQNFQPPSRPFTNGVIKPVVDFKTKNLGDIDEICGRPVRLHALIFNGKQVQRGAYPWLAALFYVDNSGVSYKCGGSLISDRHVVTAAHCTYINSKKLQPRQLLVIMGKQNLQKWTPSPEELMIETESIRRHPDYSTLKSDADIAILILSEKVQFNPYVRPICLWSGDTELLNIIGRNGTVVGWGMDENGEIKTTEPKQIQIPIVSLDKCILSTPNLVNALSLRTFCAGSENGSGPCSGDSGSGFAIYMNGRWMLRGVVSIAVTDPITHLCDLTQFVVFTDVSKHLDWIFNIIK